MEETDPRWHVEDLRPVYDLPPDEHHDQPDEDPPDLPPVDET